MLDAEKLVAFGATTDATLAGAFYGKVLELPLRYEDEFTIVFDASGSELRLQKLDRFTPQPFTVLGWQVTDVAALVERLVAAGVRPERYEWLDQDARGIWSAPSGARVAWFKDPDGNLLSVAQHPAA